MRSTAIDRLTYNSIDLDRKINLSLLPAVYDLFHVYDDVFDDYWPKGSYDKNVAILKEIKDCYGFFFLVTLGDTNEPVACIWFNDIYGNSDKIQCLNMHSLVHKRYWGEIVKQGLNDMFDFVFNQLDIERLEMLILEDNKLAIAFAERYNFQKEGVARNATTKNGKNTNIIIYSKLKEEYNNE